MLSSMSPADGRLSLRMPWFQKDSQYAIVEFYPLSGESDFPTTAIA